MKRYVLMSSLVCILLFACSEEELNETENINLEENIDLFQGDFLPTFTNYFGRDMGTSTYKSASLSGEWEHEYDEKGRLIRSTMYELYPSRILKRISFSNYSSDNMEVNIKVESFTYYLTFQNSVEYTASLKFNEDFSLNRIIDEGGGYGSFDELNSQGYVTKLGNVIPDGTKIWTTNYDYDNAGNVIKYYTTYHQYHIQDASVDYTYTSFGDPKSYKFQNEEGSFKEAEYFYREDNTLERLEETFNFGDGEAGKNIFLYTENEAYLEKRVEYDNGAKLIIDYDHEDGQITEKKYAANGDLSMVTDYLLSEQFQRYFLSTCKEYVNGMISSIKYYDIDGDILKREFYDESGVLEYTEYYDEEGNYTHTEEA